MQHDDLIWKNVDQYFCSFKVKTVKATFCRNKYNLTGLCSRMSCPLANSRYATIIEDGDQLLLYIKTVERAHSPRRLWEKIKLSRNYTKALMQIDKYLEHWPEYYIHKAKQRLTKMTQYFLRRRRLALRTKTRLVGVKKKVERREAGREKKAITAAKLESAIEKELLQRLRSGAYGDIYNFPQEQYEKVLEEEEEGEQFEDEEEEMESGDEYEAEYEDSEEEDLVDIEDDDGQASVGSGEYDFDDFSDGDDSSSEGDSDGSPESKDIGKYVRERASKREKSRRQGAMTKGKKGHLLRRRGGVRVEMEYEREQETIKTPELVKQ